MMRFALLFVALAALLTGFLAGAAAQAPAPVVRARVATDGALYAGQQVRIEVDVLVPNYLMSPPRFPAFDLPGAIVTLSDGALNLNETIDGAAFAGIRRSYLVTPQSAGSYRLPPATITFRYAAVPGQASDGEVTLPPTPFTVVAAAGGAGGTSVTAARVTVEQTLDRDNADLRSGDALVRTVVVRAEGMQAMMIPETDFEAPPGVRVYRHDPVLDDEKTPRGDLVAALRTDSATYLFETAGHYTLPAISIGWFDPASGTSETAAVPAVEVTVTAAAATADDTGLPPPAGDTASAPERPAPDWRRIGLSAGAGAVLLALSLWLAARVPARIRAVFARRRTAYEASEAAYFDRFMAAARGEDDAGARTALYAWMARSGIGEAGQWLVEQGEPGAANAFRDIERKWFGRREDAAAIATRELARAMARARATWLANHRRAAAASPGLAGLNDWLDRSRNQSAARNAAPP